MSLRIELSRGACFGHVLLLDFDPIGYSAAQVVRMLSQHGDLLGCWVQPQSFEILSESPPKQY
jgi:hypothetical protein